MTIDAHLSSIAALADSAAGDIQACLVADDGAAPNIRSAAAALSTLHAAAVQLRSILQDMAGYGGETEGMAPEVRASMEETLGACRTQAAALVKQIARLSADSVANTGDGFWTVLSAFVGAHVKLLNCYAEIAPLFTPDLQNERFQSAPTREVLQQASHAVHLAGSAPDIFDAPPTAALPYRTKKQDGEDLPGYHGDGPPAYQPDDPRRASASSLSSSLGRRPTWERIKSGGKALRERVKPAVHPLTDELCAAVFGNETKAVEDLLARGAPVDGVSSHKDLPLLIAARSNHLDAARMLIAAGASLNAYKPQEMPAVFAAACRGHVEMVNLLLAHRADVAAKDATGRPFFVHVVDSGNVRGLQPLLAHGANANSRDITGQAPVAHAVATNDNPMATMLLAFGADPNSTDVTGRPLLLTALALSNFAMVRFLLDNGADANGRDITGASALAVACERFQTKNDMVSLLLRRGARADSKTVVGVTVLADALVRGETALAKLLLAHGADPVLAKEVTGQPGVITVVRSKRILLADKLELLRAMCEMGASVLVRDFVTRETAVEVARKVEGKQVVRLLEEFENRP